MSVPPAPPRKNKHLDAVSGNGRNAATRLRSSPALLGHEHESTEDKSEVLEEQEIVTPRSLEDDTPETIIGKNVVVKGELKFDKLLRIDGLCTGQLISSGNLIVGGNGKVVGNIDNMVSVLVEGTVVGNINVRLVCLRHGAKVFGDITCKSIRIDPDCILSGKLNVNPNAPKQIGSDGKEVSSFKGDGKQVDDPSIALKKSLDNEALRKKQEEEKIKNSLENEKNIVKDPSKPTLKENDCSKNLTKQEADSKSHVVDMKTRKVVDEEISKTQDDAAALKKKEEEELAQMEKLKEEDAEKARIKREEEREASRKKEEAARKKIEEEEAEGARKKKEEEEAARKKKEEDEEAARKKREEEEVEVSKKKKEEEEEAARKKREEEEAEVAKKKKEEEEEAAKKKKEEDERAMQENNDDDEEEAALMRDLEGS